MCYEQRVYDRSHVLFSVEKERSANPMCITECVTPARQGDFANTNCWALEVAKFCQIDIYSDDYLLVWLAWSG